MKKIKVVPNWLKWPENWWKIISRFQSPLPIGDKKNVDNKNQSCPKLAKMAKKLIRNNFLISPSPPIKDQKKVDKQIKLVPNWPKWRENWSETTLRFWNPHPPIRPE